LLEESLLAAMEAAGGDWQSVFATRSRRKKHKEERREQRVRDLKNVRENQIAAEKRACAYPN